MALIPFSIRSGPVAAASVRSRVPARASVPRATLGPAERAGHRAKLSELRETAGRSLAEAVPLSSSPSLAPMLRRLVGKVEQVVSQDTTGALRNDPGLIAQATQVPSALALFGDRAMKAAPDAQVEGFSVQALAKLGFKRLDRFVGYPEETRQLVANRVHGRAPGDTRPLAVVVYPRHDTTTLIGLDGFKDLLKGYHVQFFEASTRDQALGQIRAATEREQAEVLLVAGHGERGTLNLGSPHHQWSKATRARYIDVTDRAVLESALRGRIKSGGHWILLSCSTGLGNSGRSNLANTFARVFPEQRGWAPSNNATGAPEYVFGPEGKLIAALHKTGPTDITYHVDPSRSRPAAQGNTRVEE